MTTATTTVEDAAPDNGAVIDGIDDRLILVERKIDDIATQVAEIHLFAGRLAATLDGLAGNPMVAAMLPPGAFGG